MVVIKKALRMYTKRLGKDGVTTSPFLLLYMYVLVKEAWDTIVNGLKWQYPGNTKRDDFINATFPMSQGNCLEWCVSIVRQLIVNANMMCVEFLNFFYFLSN